jgi:hypothetical protein
MADLRLCVRCGGALFLARERPNPIERRAK